MPLSLRLALSVSLVFVSHCPLASAEPSPLKGLLTWSEESGPAGREHAVFLADDGDGRALLLAGSGYRPYGAPLPDAWILDFADEVWSPIEVTGEAPPPAGSRRWSSTSDGTFLFGGYLEGFQLDNRLVRIRFDAKQVSCESVPQTTPPPPRALHGFASDPSGKRFVVFGGASETNIFGDTWIGERTDEGVAWKELSFEDKPESRFGFSFGYDPETRRLLVCGGQVPPKPGGPPLAFAQDLWALDFQSETPTWSRLAEFDAKEFPGRRNPAFVFDAATGDLLVWGGTNDGEKPLHGLYVLQTRQEGVPFEVHEESGKIKTRASGFGVIDDKRRRAFLGFGNTKAGAFRDLAIVGLREGKGVVD